MPSHETPSEKKIKSIQKALHGYSKKKTKWDEKGAPEKSTKQPTVRQKNNKKKQRRKCNYKTERYTRALLYCILYFLINNFFLT